MVRAGGVIIEESSKVIFGQFGLVKTAYMGAANGIWKGPVTDYRYPFGAGDRIRFVDRRDLEGEGECKGMLTWLDGEGKQLFARIP